MKLIFLDFDGVLHPVTAYGSKRFRNAKLLAKAIKGFEDSTRLVISSDTRDYYSLDELREMLPSSLRPLVIGVTPVIASQFQRHTEINAFIKSFGKCNDWRALDDNAKGFPDGCSQLILCDSNEGLSIAGAERVRGWLADSS